MPGNLKAMAQTTDGYLWLGTSNGLFRFDGARFERLTPKNGESLPSEIIVSLLAVPDGGLWIANRRNGVSLLKGGHLTNFSRENGIAVRTAYGIVRDADGAIWAAGGPRWSLPIRWLGMARHSSRLEREESISGLVVVRLSRV